MDTATPTPPPTTDTTTECHTHWEISYGNGNSRSLAVLHDISRVLDHVQFLRKHGRTNLRIDLVTKTVETREVGYEELQDLVRIEATQ